MVAILGDLAVAAIGQAAHFAGEELAAAGDLAPALLGLAGDADGRQFVSRLPSSHRASRRQRARSSSLWVLRAPLSAMGVMRKLCAPTVTNRRWSTKPKPHDSSTHTTWRPSATQRCACATSSSRVNLRGAWGAAWSFCATAMVKARCTSRPSLSNGRRRQDGAGQGLARRHGGRAAAQRAVAQRAVALRACPAWARGLGSRV